GGQPRSAPAARPTSYMWSPHTSAAVSMSGSGPDRAPHVQETIVQPSSSSSKLLVCSATVGPLGPDAGHLVVEAGFLVVRPGRDRVARFLVLVEVGVQLCRRVELG